VDDAIWITIIVCLTALLGELMWLSGRYVNTKDGDE